MPTPFTRHLHYGRGGRVVGKTYTVLPSIERRPCDGWARCAISGMLPKAQKKVISAQQQLNPDLAYLGYERIASSTSLEHCNTVHRRCQELLHQEVDQGERASMFRRW